MSLWADMVRIPLSHCTDNGSGLYLGCAGNTQVLNSVIFFRGVLIYQLNFQLVKTGLICLLKCLVFTMVL